MLSLLLLENTSVYRGPPLVRSSVGKIYSGLMKGVASHDG